MSRTKAKARLEQYLDYGGFGPVEREYRFHPTRKWRFDYFLPRQGPHGTAIEYDGFLHAGTNASHASINGILRDTEKFNTATAMGIRVFRANAKSITDDSFFALMDSVLTVIERNEEPACST